MKGSIIKLVNGIVLRVMDKEDRGIVNHDLNLEDLKIVVFTVSYFKNNVYLTTQLFFAIILLDGQSGLKFYNTSVNIRRE